MSSTPTLSRTATSRPSPLRPTSPSSAATLSAARIAPATPKTPKTPTTPRPRARDLLRKHYGLGLGLPVPQGKLNDPMDVAFEAKTYYEQLITTAPLSTLLKREIELLSEMRQLDSERQALVYNHHHELIAASDTISAMRVRADSLDADLDSLRTAFSEISRLSSELGTEHAPRPTRSSSLPTRRSKDT